MEPIYETQGHYPNDMLSQTDNESNKGGRAKSWTNRVIHHLKSLKSGNKWEMDFRTWDKCSFF